MVEVQCTPRSDRKKERSFLRGPSVISTTSTCKLNRNMWYVYPVQDLVHGVQCVCGTHNTSRSRYSRYPAGTHVVVVL